MKFYSATSIALLLLTTASSSMASCVTSCNSCSDCETGYACVELPTDGSRICIAKEKIMSCKQPQLCKIRPVAVVPAASSPIASPVVQAEPSIDHASGPSESVPVVVNVVAPTASVEAPQTSSASVLSTSAVEEPQSSAAIEATPIAPVSVTEGLSYGAPVSSVVVEPTSAVEEPQSSSVMESAPIATASVTEGLSYGAPVSSVVVEPTSAASTESTSVYGTPVANGPSYGSSGAAPMPVVEPAVTQIDEQTSSTECYQSGSVYSTDILTTLSATPTVVAEVSSVSTDSPCDPTSTASVPAVVPATTASEPAVVPATTASEPVATPFTPTATPSATSTPVPNAIVPIAPIPNGPIGSQPIKQGTPSLPQFFVSASPSPQGVQPIIAPANGPQAAAAAPLQQNPAFAQSGATQTKGLLVDPRGYRCGLAAQGAKCPDGMSCSVFGWCGIGSEYSGLSCQNEYGRCGNGKKEAGRCGPLFGGQSCAGEGECCSLFGHCGTGKAFCNDKSLRAFRSASAPLQ